MATATTEEVTSIECGFCLRQGEALDEPKQLPCTHVHCLVCLSGFFEETHAVQCPLPTCGKVFDVQLTDLQSYKLDGNMNKSCDVCTSTSAESQPGVVYCTLCDKKMCSKHQELHNELHSKHPTTDIDKYLLHKDKQQARICTEHNGQPLSMGCKKCLKMFCIKYVSRRKSCTDGLAHELMCLDQLLLIINKELDELKAKVVEKEEILEQLFKSASKSLSEFEEETKGLVEMIHETRDKQIENLRRKYDKLEEELRVDRLRVKNQLVLFMEEEVEKRWFNVRNYRLRMEARRAHKHQCDLVHGYKDTINELQNLVDGVLPSLKVVEVSKLNRKETVSDVAFEIVSSKGFIFPSIPLHKSVQLLKSVQIENSPISVRQWKGQTFVGLRSSNMASIDSDYRVNPSFLTFKSYPSAIEVYNDRLYTLVYGKPWSIYVHDTQGNLVTSWNHIDTNFNSYNGMAIVAEQIVAPDRTNKCLHLYSLSGNLIRSISCPQLCRSWVSLCALGTDSVIVSDSESSEVFRMNISTGEVMWTCKHVARPLAVTCYGEKYIFVAARGSRTLRVLDSTTGQKVCELTDNAICGGGIFYSVSDMYITGNTLVVVNIDANTVVFFQLLA